ncbi:hypothetical protein QUC31_008832 [Theobroma cacao]
MELSQMLHCPAGESGLDLYTAAESGLNLLLYLLSDRRANKDMSSDTAKENASVVDSSATEWKNDVGNSDDPGKNMNSGIVILVFSVNMSGFFQGYAQMMSSVGWRRDNVWSKGSGKGNPWGRSFKELPQDIGEALCELLDGSNDVDGSLKRDELPSKRPCIEPPYSLGDEDYNVPPLHMSWAGTPMPYHPFLYRHQADVSRFHLTHPHTLATEYFPTTTGASKVAKSPHASTLTEDDFLEMTYEEYLEAHGRTSKQLCRSVIVLASQVTAPSRTMQESTSRKHADDSLNAKQPMGEENKKINKEEVIAKLKDDGDFDKLRLKIIRKLKDNDELRNNIIAAVKQSAALNRPGAENMKPRQLSDAIHEEVGNKVMGQISDSLWEVIRSEGGMRSEITETVQSVYNKLVNPRGKEEGESSIHDKMPVKKEAENNGFIKGSAGRVDDTLSDGDPKEPPGFSLSNIHHSNHHQQQNEAEQQLPRPYENGPIENWKEEPGHPQNGQEQDDVDVGVPPGFSEDIDQKQSCDVSDEDPDVPPGFG